MDALNEKSFDLDEHAQGNHHEHVDSDEHDEFSSRMDHHEHDDYLEHMETYGMACMNKLEELSTSMEVCVFI